VSAGLVLARARPVGMKKFRAALESDPSPRLSRRRVGPPQGLVQGPSEDFLRLVPAIGIVIQTTPNPLWQAIQALTDLRAGRFEGAAVLLS
jgi:hypothetical protein